ncbi:hypothetical protein PMNALOAF_2719 [Methylobacterium adhaesivum]|uniref:DUF2158 domain-containing protein n=1 Tax=Methylobacterium adhaesivum TaxID=333297 RepID=A0ABT8BLL0_9HYPH|nr:DUF2158 domain-containing protein [Methylobacterium adhaesivum]MDN3592074.1 DUF2158 domain-containing protein [Methylobacterium adhaesivum]GJD31460.1 hypothetical protein PMNALOAF_2719 [Methylobacterium adhaesivum]
MRRPPFAVGDLVELKSGSPDMTVTAVTDESVCVAWCGTDDTGTLHQTELPIGALQKCEPVTPESTGRPRTPPVSGGFGGRGTNRLGFDLDDDIPF